MKRGNSATKPASRPGSPAVSPSSTNSAASPASRIPLIVAVITLVTFLILVVVLRSIPLAAIAVALNLSTVGVAFGVLTLLFNVPAGTPLGGNSYVDSVTAVMIFGIVFGLSIDYAVFLLSRMREHYDRHGDNAAAIELRAREDRAGDHRRGGDHDGRLRRLRDRFRSPASASWGSASRSRSCSTPPWSGSSSCRR